MAASCASVRYKLQVSSGYTFRLAFKPSVALPCPPIRLRYDPSLGESVDYRTRRTRLFKVEYPEALAPVAPRMASTLTEAIEAEWREWGLNLEPTLVFQFVPARCWPAAFEIESRWRPPDKTMELGLALPILAPGAAFTESIAGAALPIHSTFGVARSITDFILMKSRRGALLSGARWFREGVATLIASRVCERVGVAPPYPIDWANRNLNEAGIDLLRWAGDRGSEESMVDLQAAAYALAARLDDRTPEGTMKRLMDRLRRYEFVDGRRLTHAIETVTGRPIENFFRAE